VHRPAVAGASGTASASTPADRAIASLATPSAAIKSAEACVTTRWGSVVDRAIRSRAARCSSEASSGGAAIVDMMAN
jgi:hypothetical protein